jgi:hypothetical protein
MSTDRRKMRMSRLKNVSMVSIITFVTMLSVVNKVSVYFLVTMSTLTNECTNDPTVTCISCMSRLPKSMSYIYANLSEAFLSANIFVF